VNEKGTSMNTKALCCTALGALFVIVSGVTGHEPSLAQKPLVLRSAATGKAFYESLLKTEGYSVEGVTQLQEAARSGKRATVRWAALYLLGDRLGRDGTPTFKNALADPDWYVRKTAALLLGAFGDKSGIEVLRRDLAAFAPRNGEPDPNMMKLEGKEWERAKGRWNAQLGNAIQVAETLAALGDASGLPLAARLSVEGEYDAHRAHAINTLTNLVILATTDKSALGGQTIDPESVLLAVAESETNAGVLRALKTNAAKLPREKSARLYEKLAASPHLDEKDREAVRGYLKMHERDARRQAQDQTAESKRK
jgi:hypothetical protein